ncbi:hypothetical protein XANCAGTX0491_001343 [Xanthoria calcicola]
MSTAADAPSQNGLTVAPEPEPPHILIIGAGITGLVLAQALKKHGIAFTIFERDAHVAARGRGWGLTIHWSLDTFLSLLPQHIIDKLPQVYVDPEASKRGENGNFLFFDLRSGETRWQVPPTKRIRVSRERLRALMLEGLDWSKSLASISTPDSHTVTACFTDSTSATGTLLIGADGLRSRVRSTLLASDPSRAINHVLPVRLLGTSVVYPRHLALQMRKLDPFFFQGGDPKSDVFMWFSFLDTPANNTRDDPDTYECQILLSWPYREGFRGREKPLDPPSTNEERIKLMKELVNGWANPFRDCIMNIPANADIKTIPLEDFVPKNALWNNKDGRATLIGDAAHAMTMFRGDAANHGIIDVSVLLSNILSTIPSASTASSTEAKPLKQAVDNYEAEMIQRTTPAVLTSRRACLDAHDYKSITDQSPLVSRRVMITQE